MIDKNINKNRPDVSQTFYAMSVGDVVRFFGSDREVGLTQELVKEYRKQFGENVLPDDGSEPWYEILIGQLKSPLMYIVIAAALVSVFLGHFADAVFIIIVVLINVLVGFIQEFKAEKALAKLQEDVRFYCTVLRGGHKHEVDSSELVPGDVVYLETGSRVGADGRVIESEEMMVREAVLTGESVPVKKVSKELSLGLEVPEQTNMVFSGTIVESGRGMFIVTGIGANTEIGKISSLLSQTKEQMTPLQKKFAHLSRIVGIGIVALVALFAIVGLVKGQELNTVFVTAVALVVSAIPEGLLPAVIVVLVLGMVRLSKRKALVRKLNATETMGAIDVICMDKTGTLTKGVMHVTEIVSNYGEKKFPDELHPEENRFYSHPTTASSQAALLETMTFVHESYVDNPDAPRSEWSLRGRPTDRALLRASIELGFYQESLPKDLQLLKEIPFRSETKYAARIYQVGSDRVVVYVLGAPEIVGERSLTYGVGSEKKIMTETLHEEFLHTAEEYAKEGRRLLAGAVREMSLKEYYEFEKLSEDLIIELSLCGLIALQDPLRRDVAQSVREAQHAGIRPIIITGDHRSTAVQIVRQIGMAVLPHQVIEGKELSQIDDRLLSRKLTETSVFARVLPEHKIRIVRALRKQGHVVAMVGDGVNDAPAIKAADVGISVGNGTDITKEVSDIVLVDTSFTTIVKAIEEGRLIFSNIRRVIVYLVADDFSELFLFFTALILGWPLPLAAAQILWINLVEDSFPNMALTSEADRTGLMDDKPRKLSEPIFDKPFRRFLFAIFIISSLASFVVFWIAVKLGGDVEKMRTLVFALVAFDSLLFAYVVRSFRRTMFRWDIFSNQWLNGAVFISFLLLLVAIYVPLLQSFLGTVPLGAKEWGIVVVITIVEIILLEIAKIIVFRKKKV